MKSLMEMNVSSTVWMTRLALPGMVARKRGAIVNFGSAAALNPSALLAGYSGAKGFILVRARTVFVCILPRSSSRQPARTSLSWCPTETDTFLLMSMWNWQCQCWSMRPGKHVPPQEYSGPMVVAVSDFADYLNVSVSWAVSNLLYYDCRLSVEPPAGAIDVFAIDTIARRVMLHGGCSYKNAHPRNAGTRRLTVNTARS